MGWVDKVFLAEARQRAKEKVVYGRLYALRRTGPFSRVVASGALRRAGTAVRNGSDADVIYYLNRTRLPVIGAES